MVIKRKKDHIDIIIVFNTGRFDVLWLEPWQKLDNVFIYFYFFENFRFGVVVRGGGVVCFRDKYLNVWPLST